MDKAIIKGVQKIASHRAGKNYDYETVEQICEAMYLLSASIIKHNEKGGTK